MKKNASFSSQDQSYRRQTDFFEVESEEALEVFENERYDAKSKSWSCMNLISSDPRRYKSASGQCSVFPDLPPPENFVFTGKWEIDTSPEASDNGWLYAENFLELDLNHYIMKTSKAMVRRRRWIRRLLPCPPCANTVSPDDITSNTPPVPPDQMSSPELDVLLKYSSILGRSNSVKRMSAGVSAGGSVGESEANNYDDVLACDVEFEDETTASIKDTDSVMGDTLPSTSNIHNNSSAANTPPKKRNSFFSAFRRDSYTDSNSTTAATESSSASTTSSSNKPRSTDPTLKVQSTTLSAVGKQIKFLEAESKRAEEERKKHWKDEEKPQLESTMADLEKKAGVLKLRLEKEANKGTEHISQLDEELRKMLDNLDILKQKYYFPTSAYTTGNGGVYLALSDFWLESCSGSFFVELCVERGTPFIHLHLAGTDSKDEKAGVSTKVKLEGFKLAGDKGKGVPKLSFDVLNITVAFSARLRLHFDMESQKWRLPKTDLNLKIISFKGPYGLNRGIISLVVSLLTPTIRSKLLAVIPFELGLLVRTLPCPCIIKGQFHVNGIDINTLSTEMFKAPLMADMSSYSTTQLEMFYFLQKALDRSPVMKSIGDLITYMKYHEQNGTIWRQLQHIWSQATILYCERVQVAKQEGQFNIQQSVQSTQSVEQIEKDYSITFESFVDIAEELLRKRINTHFKLQHVEGQISINHLMSFIFQIIERTLNETIAKASNNLQRIRLISLMERIRENYRYILELIKMTSKNLDFAQLALNMTIHSGSEGFITTEIKQILAQAPILLQFNFSKEKNIGALPLVPYILSVKPQENGDVIVEIYHFTHDSTEVSLLVQDMTLNNVPMSKKDRSSGVDSTSHNNSALLEALSDPGKSEVNANNAYVQQSNLRTGYYSTSYNRVVNSITSSQSGLVLRKQQTYQRTSEQNTGEIINHAHLLVREEELIRRLNEILTDYPIGRQADTVISITTSSPHLSVIVDKAATLKPGAELFTLLLGPQQADWKPFGTPNMFAEDEAREKAKEEEPYPKESSNNKPTSFVPEYEEIVYNHPTVENKGKPGCPIMMQTSPGIKLLVQVPTVAVNIALPSLVRFFLAHFADMQLLKVYLESLFGGEFYEEQLAMIKMIVEKVTRYLLLPGLDIDININGKIVTLNGEIMVRIDTPKDFNIHDSDVNNISFMPTSNNHMNANAIELKAQLSLKQLFEDGKQIEAYIKNNSSTNVNSNNSS